MNGEERKKVTVGYEEFIRDFMAELNFSPMVIDRMLRAATDEGKDMLFVTGTHEITVSHDALKAHYLGPMNLVEKQGDDHGDNQESKEEAPEPSAPTLSELDSLASPTQKPAEEKGAAVPANAPRIFRSPGRPKKLTPDE